MSHYSDYSAAYIDAANICLGLAREVDPGDKRLVHAAAYCVSMAATERLIELQMRGDATQTPQGILADP